MSLLNSFTFAAITAHSMNVQMNTTTAAWQRASLGHATLQQQLWSGEDEQPQALSRQVDTQNGRAGLRDFEESAGAQTFMGLDIKILQQLDHV